jgi:hypothetical protein
MPLTEKGQRILKEMKDEYGPEKGREVFYASLNKGTISGVEEKSGGNKQSKSSRKSRSKNKGS